MKQNKLTFQSEKLVVDWIGFKFQNLDNFAQTKLAKYLFEIGFNSYQESGKLAKPVKESIFVSSDNKFQVLFVNQGPYWKGTYYSIKLKFIQIVLNFQKSFFNKTSKLIFCIFFVTVKVVTDILYVV